MSQLPHSPKMKLFYYPPASYKGYSNPYSIHYKKALEQYFYVLDKDNKPAKVLSWSFFKNSFIADVFIVNWLESIYFLRLGYIQYLLVRIGLMVIRWRKKPIIWMFHNIHPHQGDNKYSRKIQNILFKQSKLIISHSQEAAEFARQKTGNKVIYKCHPVSIISVKPFKGEVEPCDVLIWGAILPYKGIYEFISDSNVQEANLRIRIIGRCSDNELCKRITDQCNKNITFENRRIDFDELTACITKSRYVLFPYIGNCVSSSGALIDTIALGGIPIGPHVGAFKDLEDEEMCITYSNYKELVNLLKMNSKSQYKETINNFITQNSWGNFSRLLYQSITENEK